MESNPTPNPTGGTRIDPLNICRICPRASEFPYSSAASSLSQVVTAFSNFSSLPKRLTPRNSFSLRKRWKSLGTRSGERTDEDLEIIYEELLHIKALSHLSNSVKRELAGVLVFESHPKAGTVCKRR
ncbi:hypothetical protein AVEN_58821-1 [Araneus ventricosus]|uniref:Uncharacterized protein n=1 Tax=Araneus ventricosus TaxID=182803 RepID=A0A4Y2UT81_ARAVE|nr:hypothetical protein AVEN_58821-1 [Araneus ventricosus]